MYLLQLPEPESGATGTVAMPVTSDESERSSTEVKPTILSRSLQDRSASPEIREGSPLMTLREVSAGWRCRKCDILF